MNTIFFTGNAGKDGEVRTVGGTDVLNFSVAVRQGFSRDAKSEWYRCAVWGQRANSLAEHIKKGGKVAVCGDLTIGSYEGKPQYDVRVHDVDPFMSKREEQGGGGSQAPRHEAGAFGQNDLDDDVPFIRADGIF